MIPPLTPQGQIFTMAQQPPSEPPPQTRAFTPWLDLPLLAAVLVYLAKAILPRFVDHSLNESAKESEADRQQEATVIATVLSTLVKLIETIVQQQNTLMASLLNSHQRLVEESPPHLEARTLTELGDEIAYLSHSINEMDTVIQGLRQYMSDPGNRDTPP